MLTKFQFLLWVLLHCSTIFCISGEGNLRSVSGSSRKSSPTHAFRESIPLLSSRNDIVKSDRLHSDYVHEVIFVIRPNNMDELTRVLHDVSDPLSLNYGQHWTKQQIDILTSNPVACDAVVAYLHATGASVISHTLNSEYITAHAPISVWEKVFDTEFFTFHQTQRNGNVDKLVRAEKYWIPKELDMHVESVFNTIQMPSRTIGNLLVPQQILESGILASDFFIGSTTPSKIKAYYNVGGYKGSDASSQGVFATINQYFSPADLKQFQVNLGLTIQPASNIGAYSSDAKCAISQSNCAEGNLDVQYMMAASPGSPTTFWYTDLSFSDWLITVANTANPPLVFSISYGAQEASMSSSELNAFSNQAIQLGAMGVTLVAASGDDGAVSDIVRGLGSSACGYSALFPASNPYVVSVGGTTGVESGALEVVSQGDLGHSYTSGGGFSAFYPQPTWQKAAVDKYFTTAALNQESPESGYNVNGRGYPDISLAGHNYAVIISGAYYRVSGTSASAPVAAGLFSNINAARLASGKGSVGWVNPTLYFNSSGYTNDITVGNNKCAANGNCCPHGFTAGLGWDPVTGLGSLNYKKMHAVFMALGGVNRAVDIPTLAPMYSPTPDPTARPTIAPTCAIYSSIQVSQTLAGISITQAQDKSFLLALAKTLTTLMGVTATVSLTQVPTPTRRVLASATLIYTAVFRTGFTTDALMLKLKTAATSGVFLTTLKANSGQPITGVSGLSTTNTSPTLSPTPMVVPEADQLSAQKATIITAVVGSIGGITTLLIVIGIACCCRFYFESAKEDRDRELELQREELASLDAVPKPVTYAEEPVQPMVPLAPFYDNQAPYLTPESSTSMPIQAPTYPYPERPPSPPRSSPQLNLYESIPSYSPSPLEPSSPRVDYTPRPTPHTASSGQYTPLPIDDQRFASTSTYF